MEIGMSSFSGPHVFLLTPNWRILSIPYRFELFSWLQKRFRPPASPTQIRWQITAVEATDSSSGKNPLQTELFSRSSVNFIRQLLVSFAEFEFGCRTMMSLWQEVALGLRRHWRIIIHSRRISLLQLVFTFDIFFFWDIVKLWTYQVVCKPNSSLHQVWLNWLWLDKLPLDFSRQHYIARWLGQPIRIILCASVLSHGFNLELLAT